MSGIPSDADQAVHHHDITIIVNAQEKTVTSREVSYTEVVDLANLGPSTTDTVYTVQFERAAKPQEGSLVAGGVVTVREKGTIFYVTRTDRS